MRKTALLFAGLLLFITLAFAQTRTVTGKLTDETGAALPFASITIKGTNQGTVADQTGSFSIKVNAGDVLVITSQGYASKEVTVGGQSVINTTLSRASDNLVEVIVSSGYNTKKTQRSTTSNAQVVNAEQLTTIRQPNINNALAGKVAGVQLRSQSVAALGRNTDIRLRGDGTLGGQSILYIVDGTPTNSVDINPDDIEDLTVLNGPTGAAIYGPQAADGAIVINTKRAKRNQRGIGVEVNSGVQFDKIYILPNYQNSYAGGGVADLTQFVWKTGMPQEWKALDGKYYHDYTDDASWGPRMAGQEYIPWYAWYPGHKYSFQTAKLLPQEDNARDFYNTGITANNNINFSKAGDNYSTRVSYTNLDIRGLIPNTYLRRHTFATNNTFDLNNHFTIGANINYVTQNQQAENDDAYSNNSTGSFNSWFHRDLDMNIMKELRDMKSAEGVLGSWNHANPNSYSSATPANFYKGNYWYNFFSFFDNQEDLFRRDRLYGDLNFTYKINNDLKVRGAYRKSLVTTWSESRTYYILETSASQTGVKAGFSTGETFFKDDRYELVGTYNKKIKDFTIDALVGGEIVKIQNKRQDMATRDGLYIPDFFAISNSLSAANLASPNGQVNPRSEEKRRAVFTRGSVGYKNMLFGEFTLRNDWYSTLPANDNGIFVKSFGASFVFSDLIKNDVPWLTYGKVRASWGEVPQAIGPYGLALGYAVGQDQWNGSFVMGTPNQITNANIKGATQTTKEIGLDLRFWKSRIGLNTTYYNAITSNSPISVAINGASGFTSQLINAGKITRDGLEFQLFARPLNIKDFNWDINATYATILDNKVVELAPDVNQITLSSGASFNGITTPITAHQVGQKWGMLIGGGKTYINGVPVLNSDGSYVKTENVKFGSVLPDYTGGIQNSFSYKGFLLNVNLDYQMGGKFFSLSDMWGSYSGLTARTAVLNDKGNPIRDAVADGGGIHVVGVDANKNVVDVYVEAQDYFHNMVGNNVFDEFIYDLTFLKMREVSLGYRFPVQKWGNVSKWLQNATFSIVARNPWLIYAKTKDFDPSEISSVFGENGQFPGTRSLGFNLRVGF